MIKEKRLSREIAMQLLFQWELQGLLFRKHETNPDFINSINMQSFLSHFLFNFYKKDKQAINTPFVIELVKGTIKSLTIIDNLIDQTSTKWKMSRMDAIDRAILRIACYELIIKGELSAPVIINEAVEIAKRYGGESSPAFINGLLDSIKEKHLSHHRLEPDISGAQ
jgi:transcription antitermination factor NusB